MSQTQTFNPGAYRTADSFLHRLDPHLKLLLLLGLMVCVFSATSPPRLLLIFLGWLVAARFCPGALHDSLKVVRLMRWLFLFTLLLHLFFTPGRTLFGTSWLSYDGLLRGLLVDSQLLLAVLCSLLLAWTTKPGDLAWGLAKLLSPLECLKIPVKELGGLIQLVLHFFPMIQEEIAALKKEKQDVTYGWLTRIRALTAMIEPLIFRLVTRADDLAKGIAAGSDLLPAGDVAFTKKLQRIDLFLFAAGVLLILLLWAL
ncbi:MAG: hypothetical protein KAT20_05435 [Desulfuromonadales bacterium]|nr:hypothetical protein [Desulfuromonadales bacterium]